MNRLLCYAHYDEKGNVKPFVKHALSQLSEFCDTTIFVSNSPVSCDDMVELNKLCSTVILNDNKGYDFTMWKIALTVEDYSKYDEIVLMNSSVYGPIVSLKNAFEQMSFMPCDFWGITESISIELHLQSYFIVFKKSVVQSILFKEFWNSVLPYNNKNMTIMSYEIGLTQWLVESGYKMGAYCNLIKLAKYQQKYNNKINMKINPSLEFVLDLLNIGNPFVKRAAIRNKMPDYSLVVKKMTENKYPAEYIDEYDCEILNTCPVCGMKGKIYYNGLKDRLNVYNVGRYDYYRCNNKCKTIWLYPLPNLDQVKNINQHYDTHNASGGDVAFQKLTGLAGKLLGIVNSANKSFGLNGKRSSYYLYELDKIPPGKLLEVGCGSGDRLNKLRELGWDVMGQENDSVVVDTLRQKGIKVIDGYLEFSDLAESHFDAVLLSHVIEHVSDPKKLLLECHRLLKPGGKLYLSTPNLNSLNHMIFKKYWSGIDVPRHFHVLSMKSLDLLLSGAGFQKISLTTVSLNAELFAMHSIDILLYKWTDSNSMPRKGKELLPSMFQLCSSIISKLTNKFGDECFAIASK